MSGFRTVGRILMTAIPAIGLVAMPARAQLEVPDPAPDLPFFKRPVAALGNCDFYPFSPNNPFELATAVLEPDSMASGALKNRADDVVFYAKYEEFIFRDDKIYRPTGTVALDIDPNLKQVIDSYAKKLLSACYTWMGREAFRQKARPNDKTLG